MHDSRQLTLFNYKTNPKKKNKPEVTPSLSSSTAKSSYFGTRWSSGKDHYKPDGLVFWK